MKIYTDFNLKHYVNAKKMIQDAYKNKECVLQKNINNLEWAKAALLAAEATRIPFIAGFSEGAIKYLGGFSVCSNMMAALIHDLNISVDVAIHLDHGSSIEVVKKAINNGFSSIMYDGSKLPIDQNCANSLIAKKLVDEHNLSLEVEVGTVGKDEDASMHDNPEEHNESIIYASLEDCEKMVKMVHPDMLAAALGSVHGHYHGKPKLDFNKMKLISEKLDVPLVLHGSSGIPFADVTKAIKSGNSKMNVNTQFQEEFYDATEDYVLRNSNKVCPGDCCKNCKCSQKTAPERKQGFYDPRKLLKDGASVMQKKMEEYLKLGRHKN